MSHEKPPREPINGHDSLVVTADKKGGAMKANRGDGGKTLQHQDGLPKLPIPPLEETCKRYLRALEGLQSPSEHAKTQSAVNEFLKKDGARLHQQLQDYAKERASYIEEFWDESYLGFDESVVLSLNPFFILEDDPTPARGSQLTRACTLILASLGFVHDLRTGQLPPDNIRGTPLDMYQYGRMFGAARVPTGHGCRLDVSPQSTHLVVMRRGQFYWFDVLDSKHRPCLTERELINNLKAIIADADKTPRNQVAQGAVGTLTTENRKVWHNLRTTLMKQRGNKACLDIIDSALFVVCLDDSAPESASEMCSNMLSGTYKLDRGVQIGTCTNRWYDKLQIIVAANGTAGVNFEHSSVDGHTVLRFVGDIYTDLILRFAKSINSKTQTLFKAQTSPWARGAGGRRPSSAQEGEEEEEIDTTPRKVEWVMTPDLRAGVRFAEARLSNLICQNEVVALEFETYGKNFITRHGFSPDAFVQMAFQAAHFSLYGRIVCTYEPAMTKMFTHGRTEAIRTVQPASAKFTKLFCSDAPNKDKIAALREACKAHTELTKECSKGLGQDRLLYAMQCLALKGDRNGESSSSEADSSDNEDSAEPKSPAFYRDAGWATLNHTVISTSNCGNPCLRLFGFGAVVQDGFGIGYIIKDEGLSFCASSKHLQTPRFLDTLRVYLLEVQRMLQQAHRQANERPSSTYVDHSGRLVDARTGKPMNRVVESDVAEDAEGASGTPVRAEEAEDMTSGYGFFDAGEMDRILTEKAKVAKKKEKEIGTRLQLSEY